MTVRMKDIANDLGLSLVTISKVLRNHPDISAETRDRVLAHVQKRDYEPNILARSLVTGRSFLIGLIVPDLTAGSDPSASRHDGHVDRDGAGSGSG